MKDEDELTPAWYALLAAEHATRYTASGEAILNPIPRDMLSEILRGLTLGHAQLYWTRRPAGLRGSPREQVTRSVDLMRASKRIQEYQNENTGAEITVFTERERPTELMALLEVILFLQVQADLNLEGGQVPGLEHYEDDIYGAS